MFKSIQRLILSMSAAVAACLTLIGLLKWNPVFAAGITVDSTADTIAADGVCTLREAVQAANTDTAVNECPAGVGSDVITITISGQIMLTSSLIVSDNLSINGPGAAQLAIDGQGNGRIFNVTTSNLTLSDVTLQNGTAGNQDGGAVYAANALTLTNVAILSSTAWLGGGAYAGGAMVLQNGLFQNNTSQGNGGGLWAGSLALNGTQFISNHTVLGDGGGAFVFAWSGATVLVNGRFQDNRSDGNSGHGGGGLLAGNDVIISGTQFIGNRANNITSEGGGGVSTQSALTATNALFQDNFSNNYGGGLYATTHLALTNTQFISNAAASGGWGGGAYAGGAVSLSGGQFQHNRADLGGGLYAGGSLTLNNAQFISNTTTGDGGGIYLSGSSVISGSLWQENGAGGNGAAIYAATVLMLTNSQIVSNTASASGGGVYVSGDGLTVTNTQFLSNTAVLSGGGAEAPGTATLNDVLFQGNQAASGGGISLRFGAVQNGAFRGNRALNKGGGLYASGRLTVSGTQFISNTAVTGGGLFANTHLSLNSSQFLSNTATTGGGLHANGYPTSTITNTLFAHNAAANGAALSLHQAISHTTNIIHVTIAGTPSPGQAAIFLPTGVLSLTNSILAGHDIDVEAQSGGLAVEDYNLFDDTAVFSATNVFTYGHSLVGDPAFLSPAADDYHLTPGSAAINQGSVSNVHTDFEGDPRPYPGTLPDIGYDETNVVTPPPPPNALPTLDQPSDQIVDEDAGQQTVILSGISSGDPNEHQLLVVTAVSTNTALIPHPTIIYASPNPTGTLRFTPVADGFGTATIQVSVSDGYSQTARSFQVTVNPINDPPTLDPIADLPLPENAGLQTVNLSGIGSGAANENQTLSVTGVSTNTALIPHPTVIYTSPDATGSLNFTPVVSQTGHAVVVVTVSDGLSQTSRSFQVTVQPTPFIVESVTPPGSGRVIAADGVISATFSRIPDSSTVTTRTFTVWGSQTGVYDGAYIPGKTINFSAWDQFKPGEKLLINLSSGLQTPSGVPLLPYAWELRTAVLSGGGVFTDSNQALGRVWSGPQKAYSVLDSQGTVLADLNGDGRLDLFVAINGSGNQVWFNDGTGRLFDSGQRLGSGDSWAVALGDFDGDGDLDAFVGNHGAGDTIWWNDGSGHFSDSGQRLGDTDTYAAATGDLNGDGYLDVVTGSDIGQANQAWLNDGSGHFYPGQALGYGDNRAVALGDLDGDGDLDVWAGLSDGRANLVWWNDGGMQGGTPAHFSDSGQQLGSSDTYAVALGDLDGDGDLDAFTGNLNGEPNRVWLNDGSGGFSDSGQSLGSNASWAVALGDLDGDGDLDAFVGNVSFGLNAAPGNTVWLNDGSGHFQDSGQSLGSGDSWAVSLGDVDSDGDLDAFAGNSDRLQQANKLWLNVDPSEQPVSVQVNPGQPNNLVYTNRNGSQTLVDFPAGVVTQTTEFRLTPLSHPNQQMSLQVAAGYPLGMDFAGHAFVLAAYQNNVLLPDLQPARAITVTVEYTDADIAGLKEDTLVLRFLTNGIWSSKGIKPVTLDNGANRLTVAVTNLGELVLLGQAQTHWIYLPIVANR